MEVGCTCRRVRYRLSGKPLIVHACHCRWCQRETGTAHALNALYGGGGFNRSAQHLLILRVRRCAMVTSRIWFTAAQKAELWERWKNGQSAAAISRALERKNKTGVERIVVLHGGIVPARRWRALAALRFDEREEISRGIAVGRSIRQIAQGLRRAPSTVSREIRRNGGSQAYRANRADRRARERALRPKPCRLALYSALRWRVAQ